MNYLTPYLKLFLLIIALVFSLFTFAQNTPKVGLVLSGGGAKGIAHIGVLQELERRGIKPDYIVGTSIGALLGGLYAIGYSPTEIELIIKSADWDYLINDKIKRSNYLLGEKSKDKKSVISFPLEGIKPNIPNGLFNGNNILTLIETLTKDYSKNVNFDNLPIPFRCIATNIETGEEKIFDNGRLSDALRASMSIPSVFTPYEIDDELYVDGGLVNNFPVNIAKEMGSDIIIGVDVGATAYKKEEINTLVKVLDQATSFYNYKIAEENKKLCSIYIRPDISTSNILNFANIDTIIKQGITATNNISENIDSIFESYHLKSIESKPNLSEPFFIDSISINPNKKQEKTLRLIERKLNLEKKALTTSLVESKINSLYASHQFESISLTFHPKDSANNYDLHLNVKEKKNELAIGLRFDNQYGIDALIQTEFRNLLSYGSILDLDIIAGQSPQLKIQYATDRSAQLGFGSKFQYDKFQVFTYQNGIKESTLYYRRANWSFFASTNIGTANLILLGAESSAFRVSPTQNVSEIFNLEDINYNLFLSYELDTWDNSYYPNHGIKIKTRADLIQQKNAPPLNTAWSRIQSVLPISKKFKMLFGGFIGIGSPGVDTSMFKFEMGGMATNRIEWHNPMPGLQFLEQSSSNLWIINIAPRLEFYDNHFLTYTFSISAADNTTENLFTSKSKIRKGMSLKYGWLNRFGPFEVSADYSLDNNNSYTFLSFGYTF